ncbi:MAG TPA: alkyl sulfatase dimerization domain-containing protein [Phenylobacterium sp.]|jgi:alkyl sulfatase BDS1-like metallo-beta-lactamase superfamily hydrolase|uniref:alkyl sulfatase dimerization domain-containing protein n=1 Tax=Phenylobacterium sp. TaxID=1871053 RepID=UPI002D470AEB|nr:alkyl sulfatase dimerization domain-containing protein [Phenylobacterium sp.]HZZ68150.1 alkyl sulfatase dimerization domain-containing protein [Phenylobacterium sp.]
MRTLLAFTLVLGLAGAAAAQPLGANQPTGAGANQTKALEFAGGRIHQAVGFGNTFMVTTRAGDVIIDTSLPMNAKRHHALLRAVSTAPIRDIILTHSHGDHTGGVPIWKESGTKVIEQANSVAFRNYQARLEGFFAIRNAAQYNVPVGALGAGQRAANAYPGNYAAPRLADVLFDKEYKFKLGDLTFDCLSMPGETPDMLNVWIPELKALFIGDNYYASFPNMYTLRGTPPRPALNYVESIDKVLALKPEIVLPSHGTPIIGAANVQRVLTQYRDAILYVHDATVRGMDEGKEVYTLMKEIKLPPQLYVGESYGAISWSVRGIYDGYAGWFDGDPATMYATAPSESDAELVKIAGGATPVAARAQALVATDPALALRLTSAALAAEPNNLAALAARKQALDKLLAASKNSNESGWLHAGLSRVAAAQK